MKNRINNKAFTLIEILVAVAILAMVSIPISQLFSRDLSSKVLESQEVLALSIAQEKMENLKALNFDELAQKSSFEETIVVDSFTFKAKTSVERENTELIKIIVEVWQEGRGMIRLATYRGIF